MHVLLAYDEPIMGYGSLVTADRVHSQQGRRTTGAASHPPLPPQVVHPPGQPDGVTAVLMKWAHSEINLQFSIHHGGQILWVSMTAFYLPSTFLGGGGNCIHHAVEGITLQRV